MNKRGLLKMIGLAPVVPLAAAMPAAAVSSGALIGNIETSVATFDEQIKRLLPKVLKSIKNHGDAQALLSMKSATGAPER